MQHSDPDVLALVALGEAPSPAEAEHLRACADCQREVARFSRVVRGVRVEAAPAPAVVPPARVWDAIAAGTGVSVAPRPDRVVGERAAPAPRQLELVHEENPAAVVRQPQDRQPQDRQPQDRQPQDRQPRDRHRGGNRERSRLLLAVAASLVVGAAAGVLGSSLLDRNAPSAAQPTQVVAQVDLANLKNTAATGHAVVVQTANGPRIRVDTSRLPPPQGGFYEVWLIDRSIKKMVGIGILHPGEDEFAVPNGVDLSQYPIVDISVQQPGDPRHSGDSVLRGRIAG